MLCAVLLLGAQDPDVREKLRVVDALEARLGALEPFAADFQFSRTTPDGTRTPGSSVSLTVDFPRRSLDTKLTIADPDKGKSITQYSMIDQGSALTWIEGGDGLRGDVGELFDKIAAACDLCGKELEALLPATPEHPALALPRGLSLILHAEPRKGPEDGNKGFRVAVSFPGPPGSWLDLARRSDDAVMTEREDQVHFRFPSRGVEIAVERATGLPLEISTRDYDGATRRITRTRYVAGAPRQVFPAPDPKKLRPMSYGEKQGYLAAYAAVLGAATRRLRTGWSRLGNREADAIEAVAVWAARYFDLLQRLYLEKAADFYVAERLKAGKTFGALEENLDQETRELLAALSESNEFLKILRDRLEVLRAHVSADVKDETFLKVMRDAFTVERVGAKLSKPDAREFMRDALKRARQL